MSIDIAQHNSEIDVNRNYWQDKLLLKKIYGRFYALIKQRLQTGATLEIGSGIGQIKTFIPNLITSDLFSNPGIDQVESAYSLSFDDGELANIIMFDVWHHLEFPGAALRECSRVLQVGGRVIIFEPAMGLVARKIYQIFHHEPLDFRGEICWDPPPSLDLNKVPYFAAQSRAWRIFHNGEGKKKLIGWRLDECRAWSDFAYLASGGFSKPSLYPVFCLSFLELIDRILTRISKPVFAARMLVVLEKQ
jgi:SAM-dependent methyltransferase